MRIADMNWMQVEKFLELDDRAVLPIGSTEQHGYLRLTVDNILPEKVAVDACEPLGIPVFPVLSYGVTPYFQAFPGSVTLRVETHLHVVRDILDGMARSGFRRIMIVNGHGGNSAVQPFVQEWTASHPACRVRFHNWWNAPRTWAKVLEIDPVASHASWMENFPWTRLPGVQLPAYQRPMIDLETVRLLDPVALRSYLGDGNYGGVYQHDDDKMLALWQVAVEETRALLSDGSGNIVGMNITFPKRTVIVTGAAHGFGRAISIAFAERGATVWACDLIADELADTERLCGAAGGTCHARVIDVRDKDAVHTLVAEAFHVTGRVDILVNNAGGVLGQVGRPLESVTAEEWQGIFDVNVSGAFFCAQAVAVHMKAAKHGRIINISSGAGLGISLTGIQAYASAKAAQIGLTRQLAHELGPFGITVNNIAPGFVRSNAATERQWESYGEAGQRELVDRIALKRLGHADDIAHGVLFFASDYASWITGQVLSIDGGK